MWEKISGTKLQRQAQSCIWYRTRTLYRLRSTLQRMRLSFGKWTGRSWRSKPNWSNVPNMEWRSAIQIQRFEFTYLLAFSINDHPNQIGSIVNGLARKGAKVSLKDPIGLYIHSFARDSFKLPYDSEKQEYSLGGSDLVAPPAGTFTFPRGDINKNLAMRIKVEIPAGTKIRDGKELRQANVSDLRDGVSNNDNVKYGAHFAEYIQVHLYGITIGGGTASKPQPCVDQTEELLSTTSVDSTIEVAPTRKGRGGRSHHSWCHSRLKVTYESLKSSYLRLLRQFSISKLNAMARSLLDDNSKRAIGPIEHPYNSRRLVRVQSQVLLWPLSFRQSHFTYVDKDHLVPLVPRQKETGTYLI